MTGRPPPDSPNAWLERSHSDLVLGRAALEISGVLLEDACFHAQQCAEKALKALLIQRGIVFPRTHVLEYLLDLLKKDGATIPPAVDAAIQLTQYAVETRYPGVWEPVTEEEARAALDTAALVFNWVIQQLQDDLNPD
ncbi:HEPN domain-containing protein [Litorilinea aerophila]|uniref:HEPN domain-containing protein n=1 Tax=Litorilinea aerophila TaxID=1204385 RepID=A0A540VCK8_9CHLR|nr:HEPN domain-containing protein [Litorilinea aerophila]MCC9077832.1 HEPN domain-containing protein [Litorilinea aerophila]OUC06971.1 hypothetical protein RY27_17735 [Litorilinea aerophila]GIV78979.1 MAG: DNA-binding protein [Litorilinea sp.]